MGRPRSGAASARAQRVAVAFDDGSGSRLGPVGEAVEPAPATERVLGAWALVRMGTLLNGVCCGLGLVTGSVMLGTFAGAPVGWAAFGVAGTSLWLTPALRRRLGDA